MPELKFSTFWAAVVLALASLAIPACASTTKEPLIISGPSQDPVIVEKIVHHYPDPVPTTELIAPELPTLIRGAPDDLEVCEGNAAILGDYIAGPSADFQNGLVNIIMCGLNRMCLNDEQEGAPDG